LLDEEQEDIHKSMIPPRMMVITLFFAVDRMISFIVRILL